MYAAPYLHPCRLRVHESNLPPPITASSMWTRYHHTSNPFCSYRESFRPSEQRIAFAAPAPMASGPVRRLRHGLKRRFWMHGGGRGAGAVFLCAARIVGMARASKDTQYSTGEKDTTLSRRDTIMREPPCPFPVDLKPLQNDPCERFEAYTSLFNSLD